MWIFQATASCQDFTAGINLSVVSASVKNITTDVCLYATMSDDDSQIRKRSIMYKPNYFFKSVKGGWDVIKNVFIDQETVVFHWITAFFWFRCSRTGESNCVCGIKYFVYWLYISLKADMSWRNVTCCKVLGWYLIKAHSILHTVYTSWC